MGAGEIEMEEINNAKTQTQTRENEERYKELEKVIGNQEIRIQNLQSIAFQLANYFFVFQGVIVAAISNTTNLTCSDAWFTFSLSLLAAMLNLLALFSIAIKYAQAMDLHDLTWSHFNRTAGSLYPNHEDRPEPAGFTRAFSPAAAYESERSNSLKKNKSKGEGSNNPKLLQWRDRFAQRRRYAVLAVCMGLFVAFTVVTLVGSWVITCKRDRRLGENRPGSDCLRVCDESGREMWNNVGRIDEAMQELRHNYEGLSRIIYQKEKHIQFLETKALNLSMFYVASQLVIFLSNSKSTCRKTTAWKPLFFLSLSIAVAFVLNFGTTVVVYVRTKYEQDRNYVDRDENFHRMAKLQRGTRAGADVEHEYEISLDMEQHGTRLDMFVVYQRYAHLGLTATALSAITALVLHACRSSGCPLPV